MTKKAVKTNKRGVKYPKKTRNRVLELIARGKTVTKISSMDSMPCIKTINEWKKEDVDFRNAYMQAVEDSADYGHDIIHSEAQIMLDAVKTEAEGTSTHVAAFKAFSDTMYRQIAVKSPKVYGKKGLDDLVDDDKQIKSMTIEYAD